MSMYGPPQGPPMGMPAQPAKKKGMSTGCIIAIVVVTSFFAIVGGIVLYVGYAISQNKDVQHVMSAIGDAAALATEAQSAPGTTELRALGCDQAMALDAAKMQKLLDGFVDAGTGPKTPMAPAEVEKIVMCQVTGYGAAPTCDDAAKAYVRGAAPRSKFMLTVQAHRQNQCSGVYSPSGAMLNSVGTPGATP